MATHLYLSDSSSRYDQPLNTPVMLNGIGLTAPVVGPALQAAVAGGVPRGGVLKLGEAGVAQGLVVAKIGRLLDLGSSTGIMPVHPLS